MKCIHVFWCQKICIVLNMLFKKLFLFLAQTFRNKLVLGGNKSLQRLFEKIVN